MNSDNCEFVAIDAGSVPPSAVFPYRDSDHSGSDISDCGRYRRTLQSSVGSVTWERRVGASEYVKPVIVGYWQSRGGDDSGLPRAEDQVAHMSKRGRELVVRYLRSAPVVARFRGMSTCRLCPVDKQGFGPFNGGCEQSDGAWRWPDGYAHYVESHGVRPPQGLIDAALEAAHVNRGDDI